MHRFFHRARDAAVFVAVWMSAAAAARDGLDFLCFIAPN